MSVQTECRATRSGSQKLCWGEAWLRDAKIQHVHRQIQIFWPPNIAPRKFSTPQNRHSALYPWAFTRIFHTRKKMKSGYNILSHTDYQNVRNSNIFPHPYATTPTPFYYWPIIKWINHWFYNGKARCTLRFTEYTGLFLYAKKCGLYFKFWTVSSNRLMNKHLTEYLKSNGND